MKWRIYSTPDFMKLLTSEMVCGEEATKVANKEDDMFVFIEWIQKRLNSIHYTSLTAGTEIDIPIDEKDDSVAIVNFCRFYIRMVRDPLTGICAYQKKLTDILEAKEKEHAPANSDLGVHRLFVDPSQSLAKELFRFTTRTNTDKDKTNPPYAIALIIDRVHLANANIEDDVNRINIKIVASTVNME